MRLPLEWLHEHCNPGLRVVELATRLALTGTEVDRILHHGVATPDAFVVGRVMRAERHADADRLTVCAVDVGDRVPAQIVCGAPNVGPEQTVAVARPGAIMPDGTRLTRARLRGVESEGMILAEDELGIGTDHDAIMVLDGDHAPGTPLGGVLPIATDVLELEITPNRPDCLGVYGVAREVHAATGAQLGDPPWGDDPGALEGDLPAEVVVQAPELCPRFTARVFEDVTIGASPWWLKARLMAAGMRPINNVVDITNYVMLLTAHPLHAFDLDRVAGGRLVVRRAQDRERLVTLDGQTRLLDPAICLIADDDGPTSIAGVMGGERSEVHAGTTRVLMEVANWVGANIHATSRGLGLRSEASARFEKGLAPEQAMEAQAVAAKLMVALCGATLLPGTIDVGGPGPAPQVLRLRDARVTGLLGVNVTRSESALHLQRLGFDVSERPDGLDVEVPPFRRNDVTREADLIEEVTRLHGLDEQLPATLPRRRGATGRLSVAQRLRRRAEDALVGRGLHEIAGWSFEGPERADRLRLPGDDPRRRRVVLENPMSEEQSVMRATLLGSLLDAARLNASRGAGLPRLFEVGAVYLDAGGKLPSEHHAIGAVVPGDVLAARAYVEAVLRALRVDAEVVAGEQPFLHPGRAAAVRAGGQEVGWIGDVHPLVARQWDVEGVAAFELNLDAVIAHAIVVPLYEDVTSFPELRQDIAVVVDAAIAAATVLEAIRDAAGTLLARAEVFDVYTGEQVPAGRKSLAVALAFRAPDRTLTEEDVAPVRARIVQRLADEVGGELRG